MRITALDPSLSSTGFASVDTADRQWAIDTYRSSAVPGAEYGMMGRICGIVRRVDEALAFLPVTDLFVIEAPAYSRGTGMAHERAGLWWQLYGLMYARNIPILVIKPNLRAKYATGKGNAGKDEVLLAVNKRWPEALITNNNEADAVTLAAMAADLAGEAMCEMPASHRVALRTLQAPAPRPRVARQRRLPTAPPPE